MNDWLDDLRTAVAFLTRLPMPHPEGAMPQNFVRARRMFPVVGAAIGAAVGGQTGDVLGGAEQIGETAILVLLAARLA